MNLNRFYQFLSRFSFSHSEAEIAYLLNNDAVLLSGPDAGGEAAEEKTESFYRKAIKKNKGVLPDSLPVFGKGDSDKPEVSSPPPSLRPATTGFITEDIVIEGSVTAGSNLTIAGTVNGNVTCSGNVDVSGRIQGNVSGKNVTMSSSDVTGDISAEESFVLNGGSVTGSLTVRTAEIDGTVNGNITASGLLIIKQNAVIKGDISAASVSMTQNAVVNGRLAIGKPL